MEGRERPKLSTDVVSNPVATATLPDPQIAFTSAGFCMFSCEYLHPQPPEVCPWILEPLILWEPLCPHVPPSPEGLIAVIGM